jgi:hypothetical protein
MLGILLSLARRARRVNCSTCARVFPQESVGTAPTALRPLEDESPVSLTAITIGLLIVHAILGFGQSVANGLWSRKSAPSSAKASLFGSRPR